MFRKAASTHVDWAIATSLFVVYVLLIFIFLRPGAQQIYSQTSLLKIVESNFNEDSKYSINRTPLFIRPVSGKFPTDEGNYQLLMENIDTPFGGNEEHPDHFALALTNYSVLPFSMRLKEQDEMDTLRFNATFYGTDKNYIFFLLESDEVTYENSIIDYNDPLMYKPCGPPNCNVKPAVINFTYEFGVNEIFTGFSADKLGSLPDYPDLKEGWGFPSDRSFSIVVAKATNGEMIKVINDEVPKDVNVFVNTYLDWLLQPNMATTPINVSIMVW